jgi:DNA gyrase/topoisomerase IV subunit A
MSNIVLLDNDDIPNKYTTIKAYLQTYYKFRLPYYGKRKDYILQGLKDKRTKNQHIIDFINLINDKQINLVGYNDSVMKALLKEHDLPEDMLKLPLSQLGKGSIAKLTKEIEKLTGKIEELDSRTPQSLWIADLEELLPHLIAGIVDHEL